MPHGGSLVLDVGVLPVTLERVAGFRGCFDLVTKDVKVIALPVAELIAHGEREALAYEFAIWVPYRGIQMAIRKAQRMLKEGM